MLEDNDQAIAYAFLLEAIDEVNTLLNVTEAGFNDEDWTLVKSMGKNLQGVKDVLEP